MRTTKVTPPPTPHRTTYVKAFIARNLDGTGRCQAMRDPSQLEGRILEPVPLLVEPTRNGSVLHWTAHHTVGRIQNAVRSNTRKGTS